MLCVCLLSACGGDDQAPALVQMEKINGIEVPPQPDEKNNNSTLAGIDSNNNGVRDDVERGIAKEFGTIPTAYDLAMKKVKGYQTWFTQPAPTTREEGLKFLAAVECVDVPAPKYHYYDAIFNTKERKNIDDKVSNLVLGFIGSELKCK